jgi:hypothetical protein
MAGMFEFVDVGPDFGLPVVIVDRGFTTAGAASVELAANGGRGSLRRDLDEDAADFLDVFIFSNQVFVAEDVAKAEFTGFALGFRAGVKRAVLSAQLLGRIAGHPKRFFVDHQFRPRRNFAPKVLPTAPNRETRIPVTRVPCNLSALVETLTCSFS